MPLRNSLNRASGSGCRCALVALAAWILIQASAAGEEPASSSGLQTDGTVALTESPVQKGRTEWGGTTGGAAHIAGGSPKGDFWLLQMRWGRVLTTMHGPGFLRGALQYNFEIVPAMVIRESSTVFGGGFTPVLMQYNFASGRRVLPFLQAGAGMLFTTRDVPDDTSPFNFTPQGGIGAYWLLRPRFAAVVGLRYHHISNAGTAGRNPGHNSLYFYSGFSWWR